MRLTHGEGEETLLPTHDSGTWRDRNGHLCHQHTISQRIAQFRHCRSLRPRMELLRRHWFGTSGVHSLLSPDGLAGHSCSSSLSPFSVLTELTPTTVTAGSPGLPLSL